VLGSGSSGNANDPCDGNEILRESSLFSLTAQRSPGISLTGDRALLLVEPFDFRKVWVISLSLELWG